jgi:hypothetical protein
MALHEAKIMMPVLILGPKQLGNDIDVYLRPLVMNCYCCGTKKVYGYGMNTDRRTLTYEHCYS